MTVIPSFQKFGEPKSPAFTPSKYQQAIFDWIGNGKGHAIINAVAGSGKTTTLIESIKLCHATAPGRILFLAFNKHIAETLKSEIGKKIARGEIPRDINVEAATFNAFGWSICRENVQGVKLDKFKDDLILKKIVDPELERDRYRRLKGPVLKMVSLLKSINKGTTEWNSAACMYGIELGDLQPMDQFEKVLAEVYRRSISQITTMSFDDQLFQPIFHGWKVPNFRWVLVDEAQDASPVNVEMTKQLAQHGRMILVGDPDQSIYLFRGAHPDAMGSLARDLPAIELPLSVCYRCADSIIEAAKKQVPRIEAPTPNPKGEGVVEWIETEDFFRECEPGDIVLCRTTAPLVMRCLQHIGNGVKAFVKGRDIGDGLVTLIEKIHGNDKVLKDDYYALYEQKQEPSHGPDVEAFLLQVSEYYNVNADRMTRQGRENELITLDSNVETIRVLAKSCDYTVQLIKRIEEIFSDTDSKEAITYMTGHKAKGLENRKIYILRLDLCPHPKAKTELAQRQERNLLYVMKTRAKEELYYVKKEKGEK